MSEREVTRRKLKHNRYGKRGENLITQLPISVTALIQRGFTEKSGEIQRLTFRSCSSNCLHYCLVPDVCRDAAMV